MLKLIIEDDEGRKTVVPFVRDEITIGRQEGNTIRLTERNVSRRHARLLRHSGAVKIEDLGSSNGIRVNGDRINGLVQISDGDLIQIGDYDLAIQREEDRSAGATATTPMQLPSARAAQQATARMNERENAPTVPALPAVQDLEPLSVDDASGQGLGDDGQSARNQSTAVIRMDAVQTNRREVVELDPTQAPRLLVINTEFAGREFVVAKTETRIGRVDDNDIFLDHRSLSRTHCKVVREDNGEWRVIDMQSANGLMVNGEPYAQVTLRSGDVIELGHVKLKFLAAGDSADVQSLASTRLDRDRDADTDSLDTVAPRSKAPLIAVAVVLVLLVTGGGAFAWLKNGAGPTTDAPERPLKPVAVTPPKQPDPLPPVAADPAPTAVDDAAVVKQALDEAKKALERADLAVAEAALTGCVKSTGEACPETAAMLAMIESEKTYSSALDEGARAIEAQDAAAARKRLDAAKPTKIFAARLAELEARHAELAKKKPVALVQPAPPVPQPQPAPAAPIRASKTEPLIAEARSLNTERAFPAAIERLKTCLKLEPKNLVCIRLIASTHAKLGQRDNNEEDFKKAREFYQQYLKVAPPEDEYVTKIQAILAGQ